MNEVISRRAASCFAGECATTSYKLTHSIIFALVVLSSFWLLSGCGSGGSTDPGGSGSGGTASPTITSLSPSSAKADGNAFTLTVNGTNFISSGTTVKWNGTALTTTYVNPAEVTAPATAAMITTVGTAMVTVTTKSGTSPGATFAIDPPLAPTVTAAHAPLRTRYLRTNSFYNPNDLEYAPPHFSVYDSSHQQFFISNPYMNEIDVFSAASETQTAAISVPMAWGIDISPVDGSLWAGSLLGDVYHINTSTLNVIARHPASTIGPNGFAATTALVLADGRLALQGAAGGILGVDGFGSAIVWNPQTNAVDTGTSSYGCICPYSNGGFALDGTRTLVLMTTVDENAPLPLCSYNTVTRVETDANFAQQEVAFMRQIVATPDGTKFFLTTNLDGVEVFDPATLELVGQIPPPASGFALPNGAGGAVMSLDGKTLYLADQGDGSIVGDDTTTYKQTSVVAHPGISDLQSWMVISAIDNTGLIVGPIGHGVGFADASAPESSAAEDNAQLNLSTPDTGPVSGGAAITANVAFSPPYALSQFYVGNSLISDATMSSSGEVNATAPAASGGMAVDLTALSADGTVALVPEGYSYGPTIVELVPNAATSDGGQQGAVVGYGFGNSASAIQVSIGGRSAAVNHLYDYAPISPYPFPIETLTFTIPPGTAGVSTVSITSPSGTTTGTFTYAPKAISYPVNATLQQGIYDSHRNLYFFSDTTTIQVLSPSSGTWQTPITLPGTSGASQLIGIAESPDGSTLAVADNGGQAIYVLDPDNPSSAKRYPVPAASNAPYPYPPLALVVLDNKSVYYVAKYRFGSSSADFLKLDLTTGQFKDFQIYGQEASIDQYDRVLASPDQSRVYSDLSGSEFWVDTTTDTLHRASGTAAHESLGTVDGAISADGSTISVNGYLTDDLLNPETLAVYIDWETWLPTASYGQKLNRDGSILYQPLTDGVDLIERNTGRLLYRVQVPGTLASVYDPMFLGASAGTLGYFTTAGVTFIDVSSLSIPAGAPTPFPGSSSADKTRIAVDGRVAKPLLRSRTDRPALTYSGDATRPARY